MRDLFFILSFLIVQTAAAQTAPTALRTDLLLHTDRVWSNGFLTNWSLDGADSAKFAGQLALIRSARPSFSWVLPDSRQTAYQIILSSSRKNSQANVGDIWDSGKVLSTQSVGVQLPATLRLTADRIYFWRVKTWNDQQTAGDFSVIKAFRTAPKITDYETPFYPLVKTEERTKEQRSLPGRRMLYDFGNDAFGQIFVTASAQSDRDTLVLHIGEALTPEGYVDAKPAGTLRYRRIILPLQQSKHRYAVQFKSDPRNTGPKAILMPDYIGEVLPFRYVDVDQSKISGRVEQVVREVVNYPFDEDATTFVSSDSVLNQVWDICKHTIKATTFSGYYVDGDRERIPYEADALINQLSHYATDAEYTIAKRSLNYLVFHATWPTEWSLQNVLIAWCDYLYSGDSRTVAALYPDLKAKLLLPLARPDGLISTRTGLQTPEFKESIHYTTFDGRPTIQDIVDWPQQGVLGLGKKEAGETDGFVFRDYNAVVNAFHYEGLVFMAQLAKQLGKTADATFFTNRAAQVKKAFELTFLDPKTGLVRDGDGTDHASLHANMMALAFGLIPPKHQSNVLAHIRSRGMACSVYGSQFLLDALYNAHESAYGLALMNSTAERSWYNMIRTGSTMTTEAWDTRYKPNQDWNHAWGAAPANIIVRKLMGVEPLTPAFETVQIKPQPDTLRQASLRVATLRGPIAVSFDNQPKRFRLRVTLPGNTNGVVYLPRKTAKSRVRQDGKAIKATAEGNFWRLDAVSTGTHEFEVF
ncbi:alpha-L-rhamnosidase C-terminal domain-containing protein [Spirosoma sp. KUDC1026]|uniref:alpha-L-rhamnosidase-related protein n=1 Tax=Spirosoma sp. KUDC1026 TaxID=2745947 RepID=UPI00159B972A|nr:alpha-L-rhamnosidase C-terminal domain-containing protein [Spirosoma sp. KUDC1026]QKZ13506.1 alpha-L-rhamnosidase [Spirosoma sp. KUDC1026]